MDKKKEEYSRQKQIEAKCRKKHPSSFTFKLFGTVQGGGEKGGNPGHVIEHSNDKNDGKLNRKGGEGDEEGCQENMNKEPPRIEIYGFIDLINVTNKQIEPGNRDEMDEYGQYNQKDSQRYSRIRTPHDRFGKRGDHTESRFIEEALEKGIDE